MTRINTINPSDLLDQHLIAEWRELPRIPNTIVSGKAKVNLKSIPTNYKLGTGHVLFFYNKLTYLQNRHLLICNEMDRRVIKRDPLVFVNLDNLTDVYEATLCNDWLPSTVDHDINIERLIERFDLRKRAYHLTSVDGVKQVINCDRSLNEYANLHLVKYY